MNRQDALSIIALNCISALLSFALSAQTTAGTAINGSRLNSIRTAVPFLLITPDARAGAMGDAGVAVEPDVNTLSINPSKAAFLNQPYGFSVAYSPWMKHIADDINLAYLSGYYRLDDQQTLGASLRYFSLGKIQLTDDQQQDIGETRPGEYAIDATYARRFGDSFSLGTSLRYIYSNLSSGQLVTGQQSRAGRAVAVDVSAYTRKPAFLLGHDAVLSAGLYLSNIGTKMNYSDGGKNEFLPANLKIGGAANFIFDAYNELTIALDFNKLLVPTQPEYNADGSIFRGSDPDRSVPSGIFGSFADAPGGFREELKEVSMASGLEYLYDKKFALRAGYFYESPQKGGRRYMTLGLGLKYQQLNFDFSYLLANVQKSPLANTLRFTILFNFGAVKP